ncbi:Cof-type HAD-IIB family hydrolase [Paenibacillus daejeonensis]|uniref:Cof-type HAD-IIB family hydrolase n=1 Tax=Paenibacillus daejeonensis TaxID=135193 RepID=UPI0003648CAD|nr:Cof-type HAD-IIB family hydrolase [Paenibacillus daejeonensis]
MNCRAIILDLDGTLLDSRKQVSERNEAAILACHRKGMRILFATARPPRTVEQVLPVKLREIGAFVYYNGAQIHCRASEFRYHEAIDKELTAALIDHCLAADPAADLGIEVMDTWYALREVEQHLRMNVTGAPIVQRLEELRAHDATKVLISGYAAVEELIEAFGERLSIVVTDQGELVQIASANVSKEAGVRMLCDVYGITLEDVIAFGDDYNDLGLFRSCGWPVAMGNAVAELKQAAREVTSSNDDDGVALVLERWLKGES